MQVSSVTEHVGVQDAGAKTADFDDDEGGGLVSLLLNHYIGGLCMPFFPLSRLDTSEIMSMIVVVKGRSMCSHLIGYLLDITREK